MAPTISKVGSKTTRRQTGKATCRRQDACETADRGHLAEFDQRWEILRHRVEEVTKRNQNGLIIFGPPGIGKTVAVRGTLERKRCRYEYRNAHSTARGLFELINDHPSSVLVLDDLHTLLGDKIAMQILLAALGGEIGRSRPVTWTKSGSGPAGDRVDFTGGIIAISNLPIPATALGEALRSRVTCIDTAPSPEQLAAKMRDYAKGGYTTTDGKTVAPNECRQVVDFVLEQAAALKADAGIHARVDYRTINQAYGDYVARKGKRGMRWQTLVLDQLRSMPQQQVANPATKKGRLELERIRIINAKATNDQRPKAEQLNIKQLAEQCGITKSKAYELLRLNSN